MHHSWLLPLGPIFMLGVQYKGESMYKLLITLLLVVSINGHAKESIISRIYEIDYPKTALESEILVFAQADNRVLKVQNEELLPIIEAALLSEEVVKIIIENNLIIAIEQISEKKQEKFESIYDDEDINNQPKGFLNYSPTVLSSVQKAQNYFNTMRRDYNRWSQCFNRAHIWSYDLDQKYNVRTGKIFIYFSSEFVRKYDYDWWFHVAPTVYVKGQGGSSVEMVVDRKYSSQPQLVRDWTNYFIFTKTKCLDVHAYSEYKYAKDNPNLDCILQRRSMYYWEPRDMEDQEKKGIHKTRWVQSEIDEAIRQAFKGIFSRWRF